MTTSVNGVTRRAGRPAVRATERGRHARRAAPGAAAVRHAVAAAGIGWMALAAAGCGRGGQATAEPGSESVMVGPENLYVVRSGALSSGPVVSGSLTPERQATVRAQVSGPVVAMNVEVGERVAAGAVLGRIDDTAIRDSYLSARAQVATAQQAATVAKRNLERSEKLEAAGAIAEADLEAARTQATTAESQLADARARLALARKQLDQTALRAPFAGVVSERPIDAGDVVQPGTAVVSVVDPTSMKLEASVPAQYLQNLKLGQSVSFEVRGYPGRVFEGRIRRIAPIVDPATRQVGITVSLPNAGGDLVGGLYAEGRVEAERAEGLIVPSSALMESGGPPSVLRLKQGKAEQVPVQVGLRDERAEMVIVSGNLAAGDTLLVGAAQGVSPGTPVRVQSGAEQSAPRS